MLRRLWISRRYRPNWRNHPLFAAAASRSAPFHAYRPNQLHLEPAEIVAGFFRERAVPKFFADASQIRAAVLRVRQEHPEWIDRTIMLVRQQHELGLELYAKAGPPLAAGFPWGSLEPGPGEDKLYPKRPHRFAFAPRLALAALYGEPTADLLRALLEDWMAFVSSRDSSLAYDSNLGVIQRLFALSWAWAFLAARERPSAEQLRQEAALLNVIYSDIEFLIPRLGDAFSNNHLLADAFAGWFIGCVWPELSRAKTSREHFEPVWHRELGRQTLADGTSFEHSTHYHEYACEMAVAYLILSRRNKHAVPDWVIDRVGRMLEFQAILAGPEGVTHAVGDAAEDPLFSLDSGDGWGTAAWRDLHRTLFQSGLAPSSRECRSQERAFWLLGGDVAERDSGSESYSLISYRNGGFYVFRDPVRHCRLLFRTGPTEGEAVSPGHAHSDLLSVYWSVRGNPLTVDAGTYTYRSRRSGRSRNEPDFRRYLTGPTAHNGLDIDGFDALGEVRGDFRHDSLRTFVSVDKVRDAPFVSWVDGRVVGRGVYASHRRGVVQVLGEYYLIYDLLPSAVAPSRCRFAFQFSPDVEVGRFGCRGIRIDDVASTHFLVGSSDLSEPICLTGSLDPLGGWVSRRYGEIVSAPQARFAANEDSTAAAFLLRSVESDEGIDVDVCEIGRLGVRVRVSFGEVEDTLLVNFGAAGSVLSVEGIDFRGGLSWIRCLRGAACKMRWLDGNLFEWSAKGILVESREPCPSLEIESEGGAPSVGFADAATLSVIWPRHP